MPDRDVLVTLNDNGGYSILVGGVDVSYFVSDFSVQITAGKTPIVTLHVPASRVRLGLPRAIVEALPDGTEYKEC